MAEPLEVVNTDVDAPAAEAPRTLTSSGSKVGRLGVGERDVGAVDDDGSKAEISWKTKNAARPVITGQFFWFDRMKTQRLTEAPILVCPQPPFPPAWRQKEIQHLATVITLNNSTVLSNLVIVTY